MTTAYAFLLAAHTDVLTRLGNWKGGIAVVVGTFLAGMGAAFALAELGSHESRINAAEVWIETHDDSVTGPRVAQLMRLANDQAEMRADMQATFRRLDGIETLLWCGIYEIRPCPEPAPGPPTRRIP